MAHYNPEYLCAEQTKIGLETGVMKQEEQQEPRWGLTAMKLYLLALNLADYTPGFYDTKGAGAGNHASNQFMKNLRRVAREIFKCDYSEKSICKNTKYAVDFYIPEDGTVVEVALSLKNPTSEYEQDIFKCLLAQEDGATVSSLLFIAKPGALATHNAPGSKRIREFVLKHFGLYVDILELLPATDAKELAEKARATAGP